MALFRWRENMRVGVDAIDADHKKLVELLNRLHFTALAGGDRQTVGDVLDELLDYTRYHFEREEQLMRDGNYPDYEAHRALHHKLAERVAVFRRQFDEQPEEFRLEDFYDFVAEWLLVHVLTEDMKLKPYVVGKANSAAD